jgi:dolichol-phosphate mannosyltransferase
MAEPAAQSRIPAPLRRLLSPRFITFALVGASGVFVNLGALFVLADVLHLEEVYSSAWAIEISIIWNFLLNNALTFRDKNAEASVGFLARMLRYNLVGLGGLGIQLGVFVLLTRLAMQTWSLPEPGLWKYPAQLAGIGLGMAWNFYTNFFWTWRQKPTGASIPPAPLPPIAHGVRGTSSARGDEP